MVTAPPKPRPGKGRPEKPWEAYKMDVRYLLLEPGWAGALDDDELVYIQEHLKADAGLSAWWGFRPKAKRRPIEAIKKVAEHGDADDQSHNRRLARLRPDMPVPGIESLFSARVKTFRGAERSSGSPGQLEMAFSA